MNPNPKHTIEQTEQLHKLHNMYTNPSTYSKWQILQKTTTIRNALCKPIEQNCQQQIKLIMESNLYVSIYNFMMMLIQHVRSQIQSSNCQVAPGSLVFRKLSVEGEILGECLWIFTNLCLGNSSTVNQIVGLGIMKATQSTLVMYEYPSIVQCTLQLIGNLLGEQNLHIKLHYLKSIVFAKFLNEGFCHVWNYKGCDQHITWAFSNAFRELYKMIPQNDPLIQQLLQFYLPIVSTYLNFPKSCQNSDMNLYWALTFMTIQWNYFYEQVHMLLQNRFQNSSHAVKKIMIEVYGNMVSNSQFGVKVVIEHESILPFMLGCLKNKNPDNLQQKFMKSCAWTLSNILAGTQEQIDFLLNNYSTFFNQVYEILTINSKYSIIKELTWAICNMLQCSSIQAFEMLYSSNILVCLAQKVSMILKKNKDIKLAEVYLQGMENYITKHSQQPQRFQLKIDQKKAIMSTLMQVKEYMKHQHNKMRVVDAIAYMQNIIVVEEIGLIFIQ